MSNDYLSDMNPEIGRPTNSPMLFNVPTRVNFHKFSSHVKLN